jgi:hypothetical protein
LLFAQDLDLWCDECHARKMRRTLFSVAASLVLGCSLSCPAQEKGDWRAASSTAAAITGDIAISDTKIAINFTGFPTARVRKIEPTEASAAFGADLGASGSGNLYRLSVPATKRFLHHNTLCGTEDTTWMATYVQGRTLQVAFFSGEATPVITIDALANSTDLCGTFTYVR